MPRDFSVSDMIKRNREESLWEKLKGESRPVFLYGTGNGADKILDVCIKFGIKVSGVFASSGFVRDRYFRDMKVRSLSDIEEEFGNDIVILLCFGTTLPEVAEQIREAGRRHTLYIPEVPLYGTELFDADYYEKHFERISAAEQVFADERSKKLYRDMIDFRYTGDPQYLADVENPVDSYRDLLEGKGIRIAVDCGAYRGDSASALCEALSPDKIIAAEADPGTFKKLLAFAENENRCKVVPVNAAIGDGDGETVISASAGRGSGVSGITRGAKTVTVPMLTVDTVSGGEKIDLIKYDVEGDEWEALRGSLETVKRCSPSLAVSVYHRTADLFELPLYISGICPEKKLYLRRAPCIPAWDIVLFAV